MADREEYLPTLEWFKDQIDDKLNLPKNVSKLHWKHFSAEFLLNQLREEVVELENEIHGFAYQTLGDENIFTDVDHEAIIKECADVAAFAMMIADLYRKEEVA